MPESLIVEYYEKGYSLRKIAEMFHVDRRRCSKILKDHNIKIRDTSITSRKYDCNHNYFESIDSSEKAYWLGFISADGYIESKRANGNQKLGIMLSQKDENHLKKFNLALDSNYEIKEYVGSGYNPTGKFSKLLLTSQKIVNDLKEYGIVEHKSLILKFPAKLDERYINDYIRGYFDGNGSIYFQNNGQYGISFCGTYDMLKAIKDLYNINFAIADSGKNMFEMKINSSNEAYAIASKMYYMGHTVSLDRKYEKFLDLKKYVERRGNCCG